MKEIYKVIHNFKVDKKFWKYDNLTGEDYDLRRSKPAPYINTTIKIAKLLGLKTVVEIGSTRYAVTQKCLDYFNLLDDAFVGPSCCTDGHGGFFFADNGFEVYTVDIDENCLTQNQWSYNNLRREFPDNLHLEIPKEGIKYLSEFEQKIDILFLDGWDKGTPQYALRHLEAFDAAKDKLSDVHLILIDDTDYLTKDGGKDALLSPHLIEMGYIPLFNGRQTLFLNTTDVEIKVEEETAVEEEIIYTNQYDGVKVYLTLSTTPNRLNEIREGWGVKSVLENLLNLTYDNYEIHFNIPYISHKNQEAYTIPDWLISLENEFDKLKIFRCNDYGAITKIVPTLLRIDDPNSIIITVDDDLLYEDGFIEYHLYKRNKYPNCALGFAGLGGVDTDCHFCTTLEKDARVKILEGYKTVSYLRGFFKDDFFTEFVGQSWSDDVLLSAYLGKENIKKIVMNYEKDTDFNPVVESFPVINSVRNEKSGCSLYRENSIPDNSDKYYRLGYLNK